MIINEIKGNAVSLFLEGKYNFIHGCNCHCRMGAGIDVEVKNRIPELYQADQNTRNISPVQKLGKSTHIIKDGMVAVNAYTQFCWGKPIPGTDRMADYDAIRNVFRAINSWKKENDKPFCIPLIGAGLANGDWNIIKQIINEETTNTDIVVIHFDGNK